MPEQFRRVLLCGGHLDGQWVDVPEGANVYWVPEPARPLVLIQEEPDLSIPFLDAVEYQLEPMHLTIRSAGGGPLWIGAIGYGRDRDEAVLRALLQRDVAQQLLGGR